MTKHEEREVGQILDAIALAIEEATHAMQALEAALDQATRQAKRLNAYEERGRKEHVS